MPHWQAPAIPLACQGERGGVGTYDPSMLLMPWSEILRRLPRVVLGLVLFGIGVAMMVSADLGLGPWDVFHQGLSRLTGVPIGRVIIGVGLVILIGFIPLREKVGVGTLLNALLIGATVSVALALFGRPDSMLLRGALVVGGPIVIAIGSGLYIGGGLGPGPRDGLMTGLARRGIKISRARTGIELTVLAAGLALGGTVGFGTLWFALGIGPLVAYCLPRLSMEPVKPAP
ncbi:MAG: putative membrane protein YczE [Planctomycetota bacterium]|jgi:uncharacterized membrane protein YczE